MVVCSNPFYIVHHFKFLFNVSMSVVVLVFIVCSIQEYQVTSFFFNASLVESQ